jgi:hypothetical protein
MSTIRRALTIVALAASSAWGDVVTTLSGSNLVVTGDDSADTVTIEEAPGGLTVTGFGGTLVDGASAVVTIPGVERLTVKLGDGNDRLTLTNVILARGFDLRLGRGNDTVFVDGGAAGSSRIRTGNGYDDVIVFDSPSFDSLSVETSNGNDFVEVDYAFVSQDLTIDTGSDEDDVTVFATDVGNDMRLRLGNDDDVLVLVDVFIDDDTDLDGENGDDVLFFDGFLWFGDDLDIDGFDDDW